MACVVLYVASLVIDPRAALQPQWPFNIFSPSLGRPAGARARRGPYRGSTAAGGRCSPRSICTAALCTSSSTCCGSASSGPAVEELYGPARLVIIFTVAGVSGFLASNCLGLRLHDRRLGLDLRPARRAWSRSARNAAAASARWSCGSTDSGRSSCSCSGFLMSGVNNVAHAGGFVGGFAAGLVLSLAERRAETALRSGCWPRRASGSPCWASAWRSGAPSPESSAAESPLNTQTPEGSDPGRSRDLTRQRPTLPRRCQRSTIGPGGLNFRVRDGNGCGPSGNATGNRIVPAPIGRRPTESRDSRAQPGDCIAPLIERKYEYNVVKPHGRLVPVS